MRRDPEIIQAMRNGLYDDDLTQMEYEIRERRRQIQISIQREQFAARLRKWDADKSRTHRRTPNLTAHS